MKFSLLHTLKYLCIMALLVTYFVIALGAYTRLKDAGLGCPDWPGCYGSLSLPNSIPTVLHTTLRSSATPLVQEKARAEMIHRYAAGVLGALLIIIAVLTLYFSLSKGLKYFYLASILLILLLYQAMLGMLTVTLKLLPFIVTQHLLGSMLILGTLLILLLNLFNTYRINEETLKPLRKWLVLGAALVFIQMTLGAWTSSNYAALTCHHLLHCSHLNFSHWKTAFNFITPLGPNYEGGVLDEATRALIQFTHQIMGLFVTLYLMILVIIAFIKKIYKPMVYVLCLTLSLVLFQFILGVLNIELFLPIPIAIAHDLGAASVWLMMLYATFMVFCSNPSSLKKRR